ncbi:hypothetical protein BN1723_016421 [Verticillium longisporum]|uniref:Glycosyltransferase 2-like domain-containing protein n=2 Tax=Verticillium TaxID=1036719 RepID=A0A0G4NEU7_VERLO|nr:hypothetical protein VD0004_g3544 [Verticillium dahliae]PNH74009.1 hypothetical protein VD0001_g3578 [Verticillium dahliae]RXG47302.1 hypothetical protein VDGE_07128 [Verticillium dahliae]CRK17469.1 hypothetical protein BN1708_012075 [Verticillium longisporum]CRK44938.1 hypothetical protein BN1723_016421 [Verticillium longisporum]
MASITGLDISGNALVAFCLWDMLERNLASAYAWRCQPFELAENPTFAPSDVSIVIATIQPDDSFTRALRLWLENKPKEIIIVTITRDLEAVKELVSDLEHGQDIIQVLAINHANQRQQQIHGIKMTTGKIILLADDDTFCTNSKVVPWLLAPLENPRIGAVGGKQLADIPLERRNAAISTPWEAISVFGLDTFHNTSAARFGADEDTWVLVGRAQAIRGDILRDPAFLHGFVNETWRGVPIRTGNDAFITRWVVAQGWKMAYQVADGAEVHTIPLVDRTVMRQRARWLRNSHMFFSSALLWAPGFFEMRRETPYKARKMLERVFRPLITLVHFGVWLRACKMHPHLWLVITAWYAFLYYQPYRNFAVKYPWMKRHVWALFLMDTVGSLLVELYAWLTISNDTWMTREDSA